IEAGTFSYKFEDVDVAGLVRDSVAKVALAQDEVEVGADVREELPRIRGDRDRLEQVLTNLIDNAVKYSPAGEQVRVSAYRQSSPPTATFSTAEPSSSFVATPRSSRQRATSGEYQICTGRASRSPRGSKPGRGSNSSSWRRALRIRSNRKERSASRVRSHVWTYQYGSRRSIEYGSTRCSEVDSSPSFR